MGGAAAAARRPPLPAGPPVRTFVGEPTGRRALQEVYCRRLRASQHVSENDRGAPEAVLGAALQRSRRSFITLRRRRGSASAASALRRGSWDSQFGNPAAARAPRTATWRYVTVRDDT